ncbi:MAG: hypothetical protein ACR2OR_17295 [Hyphomicrobiales bacterium]
MSQIETIMLGVLGVMVFALGFLLIARGVSSFGARKKPKRRGKASPETESEIQAERDRLRAEYAVMSRKQEIQISQLKERLTEHMAEVSRSRNKIDMLTSELEARGVEIEERDREVEGFKETVSPLESELAARTTTIQRLREELREKTEELERLHHENAAFKRREAKKDLAISRFEQIVAESGQPAPRQFEPEPIMELAAQPEADEEALHEASPEVEKKPKSAPKRRRVFGKKSTTAKKPAEKPEVSEQSETPEPDDEPAPSEAKGNGAEPEKAKETAVSKKAGIGVKRAKRKKVLSLAKRIRTLQEEAKN